jgi:kinesin family protein 2/24
MGLVATWLSGIGLSYALPSFTAAGIVTPSALAELDAIHFEALGVKNPEDRRKLFFLVQRIKMAVERKDESVEEEVDAVLANTMRSTSLILDIDDSLDELLNELQDDDGAVSVVPSPSPKARSANADKTNRSKENQQPKVAKIPSPQRTRASASIGSTTSAVTTPPAQARQVTMRRHKDEGDGVAQHHSAEFDNENGDELFVGEEDDTLEEILKVAEEDSDWDDDSTDGADDEMSSHPEVSTRRTSRRIHERRQRATSDSFIAAPTAAAAAARTSLSSSTTSTRRTTSLSRPSTGRQSSDSSHSPKRRSDGIPNLYSKDTESSMSDNSSSKAKASSKPPARRLSGVPKPKSRRATDNRTSIQNSSNSNSNNPSKSMRTGKQLSSIPAERTLPMSPLVELPSSRMTADIKAQELAFTKTKVSSRRRSTSLDRFSEQGSDSDKTSTARGGSNSDTETSRRRSDSETDGQVRRKSGRQSLSGVRSFESETLPRVSDSVPTPSRQSTGGTGIARSSSNASSRSNSDKRQSSSGSVMIQGKREDDSFKYQIAQLQADNEEEHLLFNTPGEIPDDDGEDDMRIRVIIRKRPMSKAEITAAGDVDVIHPLDYGSYGRILAYHPKTRVDLTKEIETVPFAFDNVFDDKSTNVQIYERTVRHLIPGLFEGQWASIFAYGQTGSGKTFTMMGSNLTGIRDGSSSVHPSNLGLYYMAALDLFQAIQTPGFEHFTIGVSLFEIYGGKLFDLLNDRKHIKCLEDSKGKVCFPGLSEHGLSNPDELISLIEQGAANRSTGTTSRNADSSRSHAVLQLHLRKRGGRDSDKEHSRLTFIDLAGSERGADTSSSSRATRLEGAEINTSLLALKEVIRALASGDSLAHIPFRGSKLTQVLKESFIGENNRSVMIACISPNIGNCEQTLNTLRYADRVKERNAETGEPSTNAQESGMRRPSNRKSPLALSSFTDLSSAGTSGVSNRRAPNDSVNNSFESNNSSLLDDLLSPSPMKEIEEVHVEHTTHSRSDARNCAEALISEHKSSMNTMLGMVKNEMTLVNKADADRESLDDYITNLNVIHEEQVSLFINLREHILRYRNAGKATQTQDLSDDDSIDDLRD